MSNLLHLWSFIGHVATAVTVIGIIWIACLWIRGIIRPVARLGLGLARRKVAVFAKGDNFADVCDLLTGSKIFFRNNVIQISNDAQLEKCDRASVFLVHWSDWGDNIESILNRKSEECALIVYAPLDNGPIPANKYNDISKRMHVSVTNMRGRLLNDIVTAMVTTALGGRKQ